MDNMPYTVVGIAVRRRSYNQRPTIFPELNLSCLNGPDMHELYDIYHIIYNIYIIFNCIMCSMYVYHIYIYIYYYYVLVSFDGSLSGWLEGRMGWRQWDR